MTKGIVKEILYTSATSGLDLTDWHDIARIIIETETENLEVFVTNNVEEGDTVVYDPEWDCWELLED